jgi:hypothetical protein
MPFNGSEGEEILPLDGGELTRNFRNQNPGRTKAFFIGKDHLNNILAQDGCMGIRVYYGIDSSNEPAMVFVGADAAENDIIGYVADKAKPCPTYCGLNNILNS